MDRTPRKYPRTVRDLVDQDYTDGLSAKERAWLDRFNDEFYGATFSATPLHTSVEQRRALYVTKNERNGDIYGKGLRSNSSPEAIEATAEAPSKDWTSPKHVSAPAYRETLERFRSLIPTDRRRKTLVTNEFLTIQRKIDAYSNAKTREQYGGGLSPAQQMATQNRIDRLANARRVAFNIGVTVSRASFTGGEADGAVEMLTFLHGLVDKYDTKLKALGIDPATGKPAKEESKNG